MRDYQDVVSNRFDQEVDSSSSIYSPNHPIGKYIRKYLFEALNEFSSLYYPNSSFRKNEKLLDLGCGSGGMVGYFMRNGFSGINTIGADYSKTRIEKAQLKYPDVRFVCADALLLDLEEKHFGLITSFDLLSHFKTKDQVITALNKIYNHLSDDGIFLWYDICSKNHFNAPENADSWGFNKEQMINLANEVGFELVFYRPLFKQFFNKYQSVYQVAKLPSKLIRFFEIVLPGSPGNMMMGFKKK